MSVVIDSSITLAWAFEDEKNAHADHVLEIVVADGAWVPAIWRLQVANGLQQGMKRRRINLSDRDESIADLRKLNIAIDPDTNAFAWTKTIELADRFGLTLYDASYLELAQRRALPLATLDQHLRSASERLGVPLL
jgi:predicted nucleic acid-binding protein